MKISSIKKKEKRKEEPRNNGKHFFAIPHFVLRSQAGRAEASRQRRREIQKYSLRAHAQIMN